MTREYETARRMKWLCAGAKTIEHMINILTDETILLEDLQKRGVTLRDPAYADEPGEDDYAHLVTDSIDVVREYGYLGWAYWDNSDPDQGIIYICLDENGNP
jgi:hypothetical protein